MQLHPLKLSEEGIFLIAHFPEMSKTIECWTSANQSNQAMISLPRKLGWQESDYTEELDLGDPELFFFSPTSIR
jgi:hypothetical protein